MPVGEAPHRDDRAGPRPGGAYELCRLAADGTTGSTARGRRSTGRARVHGRHAGAVGGEPPDDELFFIARGRPGGCGWAPGTSPSGSCGWRRWRSPSAGECASDARRPRCARSAAASGWTLLRDAADRRLLDGRARAGRGGPAVPVPGPGARRGPDRAGGALRRTGERVTRSERRVPVRRRSRAGSPRRARQEGARRGRARHARHRQLHGLPGDLHRQHRAPDQGDRRTASTRS